MKRVRLVWSNSYLNMHLRWNLVDTLMTNEFVIIGYHELFTVCNGPILFLNGPNPASFCLFSTFSQHNDKYNTKFDYKKHRWCAWESNPGPQDGRHRWIHWAIAVPKRSNSYLFTPLQKTYFSAFTCFVLEKEKAFRRER